MATFEFTIIATGLDPEADDFESRFYDAGCDDSTISFQKGHILVDVSREAHSLVEAIVTAVANVRDAGATVERVEPDPLVSLRDMAARSEMSPAAMTNYSKGHRLEGFPPAKLRVTTSSPLWDWADVAEWLYRQGRIDRETAIEAAVVSAANDALDCGHSEFAESLNEHLKEREEALA